MKILLNIQLALENPNILLSEKHHNIDVISLAKNFKVKSNIIINQGKLITI